MLGDKLYGGLRIYQNFIVSKFLLYQNFIVPKFYCINSKQFFNLKLKPRKRAMDFCDQKCSKKTFKLQKANAQ